MHPPGKIKQAPDFAAMMANGSRHLLGIIWKGSLWRWMECATCGAFFWKNTSTTKRLRDNWHNRVYCSKPCQLKGYRILRQAANRRYRERKLAGLIP